MKKYKKNKNGWKKKWNQESINADVGNQNIKGEMWEYEEENLWAEQILMKNEQNFEKYEHTMITNS